MNKSTISHLYDAFIVETLSAIQLLCLHLALYRHNRPKQLSEEAEDFVAYIRTLPQDFSSVPLWREVVEDETWLSVVKDEGLVPAGLRTAIEDVSKRFWKDWITTNDIWGVDTTRQLSVEDFAWAWLCVNSRCIYYDLELPAREDNITLAPIIDMGNHSPAQSTTIVQRDLDFRLLSSSDGPNQIADWSKKRIQINKGEEVKYTYSAHSDYILFAEYGFALGMPANTDNVLDVTKRVMHLFEELEAEEQNLKKSILEANGYWGEYHFILSEGKVDVSYRLTIALALYHIKPLVNKGQRGRNSARNREDAGDTDQADSSGRWNFQPFYDLVNGLVEEISAENIENINETLEQLCRDVEKDCNHALGRLATVEADKSMLEILETVWRGELWFAEHYKASDAVNAVNDEEAAVLRQPNTVPK